MQINFENQYGDVESTLLREGTHEYFGNSVFFGQSDLDPEDEFDDTPMYYKAGVVTVTVTDGVIISAVAHAEDGDVDVMDCVVGNEVTI